VKDREITHTERRGGGRERDQKLKEKCEQFAHTKG